MPRPIALVGIGKIARDQHVPAIAASPDWTLAATVSRHGTVDGVPAYTDLAAMLSAHPEIEVVSLCLPPQPRFDYAASCLRAGRHVILEKPPGQTLAEVQALDGIARDEGRTLFATWHSRAAPGVELARDILARRGVTALHITWREDVRKWHPGQDWVFEPGGMGIFDPGINALSILTRILPAPVHLTEATLETPANRAMPIAASLRFTGGVSAAFDWREQGPQIWDIDATLPDGTLRLSDGGCRLVVDGTEQPVPDIGEYPALYGRMSDLVGAGASDVDLSPMIHVADAFTLGRRITVDPFDF